MQARNQFKILFGNGPECAVQDRCLPASKSEPAKLEPNRTRQTGQTRQTERVKGPDTDPAVRISDRETWLELWDEWPNREIFAHPGYLDLFSDSKTQPACAVYSSDEGRILYPFLLRDLSGENFIPEGWQPLADIISPYGYGGAFFWGSLSSLTIDAFWSEFEAWVKKNRIISEFIRFSLFPESLLAYPGERTYKQKNIFLDLVQSEEKIWSDFAHKVRKNVKTAQKSGVEILQIDNEEKLEDFFRIYTCTMSRRSANSNYFFPVSFFENIVKFLKGNFLFFYALHDEKVISAELALTSAETVYSFLGGTDSDFFQLRPNDLIKFEIIKWAKAAGKKRFVLGGGFQPNDGIFRYKLSFAPSGTVDFIVGKRIFCTTSYKSLVDRKREMFRGADKAFPEETEFFPLYRIECK